MPRNFVNLLCLLVVLCLTGAMAGSAFGQKEKLPKTPKIKEFPPATPTTEPPGFFDEGGVTSEKSMIVDSNVLVKLCVAHGELRINGWQRNEVRVFVKDGRNFRMKPLEKSEQGKVNWLWIGNVVEGRPGPSAECLAGESIEIDAPLGASLDLSGREVRTSVDSLKKVKVTIGSGAIVLRNITGGINAETGRGDVMVESSAGAISVTGYTGNVVITDVKSGQIGDQLKARTNTGAVTMQNVEHRQIDANSISGSILFDGKFLSGGIYKFRTSSGSIRVVVPTASSFTFTATYGDGELNTELPHKILTENITPQANIVVAKVGAGDATVNLTTTNGSISIAKQKVY
ncbi:MAG: hypothetical protein DMF63_08305 [Acidobacteria bacterium]|nr:MAG: hypothetical protein DMF63_08305 [Acidobacteriota bacterium]